jgi:tRNA pseudouridine65 synthase
MKDNKENIPHAQNQLINDASLADYALSNDASMLIENNNERTSDIKNIDAVEKETLPILYQDDDLVILNKPSGLLVHRSLIDKKETRFALQIVRDQIGKYVYPVHRLDKPTSGVLVMALNKSTAQALGDQFSQQTINKEYVALVRGWLDDDGIIDYALKEELDKMSDKKAQQDKPPQDAITHYQYIDKCELPVNIEGPHSTSRYSLIRCQPKTGRKHQIRRHMKHLSHPIIGDANHGRGRHNRYFRDHLDAGRLLLHCTSISFEHPTTHKIIAVSAPLDDCFKQLLKRLNLTLK